MIVPTACPSSEPVKLPGEGFGSCMHQRKVSGHAAGYCGKVLPRSNEAGRYLSVQPRNKPALKVLMKYPGR